MKHKKGLVILIIIAAVSILFGIKSIVSNPHNPYFSFSFSSSDSDSDYEDFDNYDEFEDSSSDSIGKIISYGFKKNSDEKPKSTKSPYVSVIYITGVISEENRTYNQKWLLKQIKRAKNDKNNRGILLYINSPGGTVYESDEAYLALINYKQVTERPVFAYFASLAASGGYYIGCAADVIFANRNCLTGSIGVIAGQSVDATGLMEKIGIKMNTITAGRNKNMGNYNSPLTQEQREIMQSIADEAYEQFTGIVAEARKKPVEEIKKLADGRIYTAKQAKENGLIDAVADFELTKEDFKDYLLNDEDDKKGEDVNFIEYKYRYEENWMSLLSGAASFVNNPEASVYELLGKSSSKCLYLYQ